MKHYQAPDGSIHAYEADGTQDDLIPPNFVLLGDEQVEQRRAAQNAASLLATATAARNGALSNTDWLVIRHRDELDSGTSTTLSSEQYIEVLAYRQTLRDLPNQQGWPVITVPALEL